MSNNIVIVSLKTYQLKVIQKFTYIQKLKMKILQMLKEQNFFLFEILLIAKFVAASCPHFATSVLIQDKFCMVTFKQSAEFCKTLHDPKDTQAEDEIKREILAASATYNNYK